MTCSVTFRRRTRLADATERLGEEHLAVRPLEPGIAGAEDRSDVAESRGREQRVADGVAGGVAVAVAREAALAGQCSPASQSGVFGSSAKACTSTPVPIRGGTASAPCGPEPPAVATAVEPATARGIRCRTRGVTSASARRRSLGSVTLKDRASPGTASTAMPAEAASAASSVYSWSATA
jgi:hypothetical protein